MNQEKIRDLAAKLYALDENRRASVADKFEDLASVLRTHSALHGALSVDEEGYIYRELVDMFKTLEEVV